MNTDFLRRWWAVGDTIPRPGNYEFAALPTELTARVVRTTGFEPAAS